MSDVYILDACAVLAVLSKERGADKVVEVYKKAVFSDVSLIINKVNLLEVYYDLYRAYGKEPADRFHDELRQSPITVNHEINDEVFMEAGRLKASYRISLADSIALAEASISNGMLITADHHEFDTIEINEKILFFWIR
jgi:PIN domain nuclease of toxin-antitoxin system